MIFTRPLVRPVQKEKTHLNSQRFLKLEEQKSHYMMNNQRKKRLIYNKKVNGIYKLKKIK